VTRVLRVAFVAPDIAAAIRRGRHPPQLNTAKLLANSRLALAEILARETCDARVVLKNTATETNAQDSRYTSDCRVSDDDVFRIGRAKAA
jgi:hypothetical protein